VQHRTRLLVHNAVPDEHLVVWLSWASGNATAVLAHLGFDRTVFNWDLAGRRPGIGRYHCTNAVFVGGATWFVESSSVAPVSRSARVRHASGSPGHCWSPGRAGSCDHCATTCARRLAHVAGAAP